MDILSRIREQYDFFNKTQRRIADYLLEHPDMSSYSSLRQLASATHTTEATIISFSRRLGYSSFLDMKSHLQEYISHWMSPNEKIKTAISRTDATDSSYALTIQSEQEALARTYEYISSKDFEQALDMLHAARRVYTLSYDYATTVSSHFAARFIRIGVDVIDLGGMNIPDILYQLAFCTADDLIVIFSYAPYSQPPIVLAKYLSEQGIPALGFSDSVTSPVAQCADTLLTSVTSHIVFFNSMTAPISLINLMATVFVGEHQERFVQYKEHLDALQKLKLL